MKKFKFKCAFKYIYINKKNLLCVSVGVSSSASSSSTANGGQNIFPSAGYGTAYNYGNFYPTYPFFNPYGGPNPGNQYQATASLSNRNSFGDDVASNSAQAPFNPQLYAPNSVAAPLDYGQFLNNLQQQQNAYV